MEDPWKEHIEWYKRSMSLDGLFALIAIMALLITISLTVVMCSESKVENYDDSEYHYVMMLERKLALYEVRYDD